ncbi:hypothetical protein MTR_1g082475 [Medicago truncatula]|uniref:Uncharacterized protein n=1 Tax=Medicago truncatula TaxID=3880 RepID=A0A072VN58_MEDTR|nr:hypothetical protein MTR_1g082475 [Medicago truncatula]
MFSQVHIIAVWKRIFWVSFTFRSKYIDENYIWRVGLQRLATGRADLKALRALREELTVHPSKRFSH